MAIAYISGVSGYGNLSSATTAAINTTGASLLVAQVSSYSAMNIPTITDSKGNTWVQLNTYTIGTNTRTTLFYVKNPTVGTNHTFSVNAGDTYPALTVAAFSGTDTSANADQQNGAGGFNTTSTNTGSITPTTAGQLIIAGSTFDTVQSGGKPYINSGFTSVGTSNFVLGGNMGTYLGYKIQNTAAAENPTLTYDATNVSSQIASFKAATMGGPYNRQHATSTYKRFSSGTKVPLVILVGESNTGGWAANSSLSSPELEPRNSVQILNNTTLAAFEPLDIGTNNLLGHDQIPSTGYHGLEAGLADTVEAGVWPRNQVFLVKAGQGGSKIADWDDGDPYWEAFEARIAAAYSLLTAQGLVPVPVIWTSFGINDSYAGTNVSTWQTGTQAWIARMRAIVGPAPVMITELMTGFTSYNSAITAMAAADPKMYIIDTDGDPLQDSAHWNYLGYKSIAGKMASQSVAVAAEALTGWYNSSWQKRIKITIDHTKVNSDLVNFPVYVNFNDLDSNFFNHIRSDRGDIRVTTSDGVSEVPREIVNGNLGANGSELHFKAPAISSIADTSFYIYFGNSSASEPSATSTYGRNNVWSAYQTVHHVNAINGTQIDSTGNLNLTTATGTPTYATAAKMQNGMTFNGSSDLHSANSTVTDFTGQFAMSVWVKTAQLTQYAGIMGNLQNDTSGTGWTLENDAGYALIWLGNLTVGGGYIATNTWKHVYVTRDASNLVSIYVDGVLTGSGTQGASAASGRSFSIGSWGTNAYMFNGVIDEPRTRNTSVSAAWVATEFANQNSPSTFYIDEAIENVAVTITKTHTTGTLKRKLYPKTHTTSAMKRIRGTKVHSTNIHLYATSTNVLSTDYIDITFTDPATVVTLAHTTNVFKYVQSTKAHSTDILKRKAFVRSHTTNVLKRKATLRSHSTDVLRRKQFTVQHSTDTLKRSQVASTHLTDVLKRASFAKTHLTDVLKRKVNLVSHSTSVNKRKVFSRTHTTSVNKRKVFTRLHLTDVNKRKANIPVAHSTDILKRLQTVRSHSTDTLKRLSVAVSHLTDVFKRNQFTRTHSTDTLKRLLTTRSHTTDVLKRRSVAVSHTTDLLKRKVFTRAHTTSVNKRKANIVRTHSTDILKRVSRAITHTTDVLKRSSNAIAHSTDVFLLKVNRVQHSTDTLKRGTNVLSHTTDTNKRKSGIAVAHSTDTNKRKSGIPRSHSTDILKRKAFSLAHITDVLKRKAFVKVHSTGTLKRIRIVKSHTTSVLKRKVFPLTHSTDLLKRAISGKTHITDILKRGAYNLPHSTDVLKRSRFTRFHTTNILKRKVFTRTHSTNLLKRAIFSKSHATDVLKRGAYTLTHYTDTLKRIQSVLSHATDSFLRKRIVLSHSTSVNKRKAGVTRTHLTNVLKRAGRIISHSTDTLMGIRPDVRHNTDTFKRSENGTFHATDVLMRSRYALEHGTDLLKRATGVLTHSTSVNKLKTGITVQHSTDVVRRRTAVLTHSTSVNKRKVFLKSHTTNTLKRKRIVKTHTTSVNKRKANILVAHSTSVNKRLTGNILHFTDVLKRAIESLDHSTSVNKRKIVTLTHSTSLVKRKRSTVAHSTDVQLLRRVFTPHTTDVLKRKKRTVLHQTDVLKRTRVQKNHRTDLLKRTRGAIYHSTDVRTRVPQVLAHSTDVLRRSGRGRKMVKINNVWRAKPVSVLINGVWQQKPVRVLINGEWVLTYYNQL